VPYFKPATLDYDKELGAQGSQIGLVFFFSASDYDHNGRELTNCRWLIRVRQAVAVECGCSLTFTNNPLSPPSAHLNADFMAEEKDPQGFLILCLQLRQRKISLDLQELLFFS